MDLNLFYEKIGLLTPEEQDEIISHVDYLLSLKQDKSNYKPTLDWAGGLSFLKNDFTSVQLQKTAWDN